MRFLAYALLLIAVLSFAAGVASCAEADCAGPVHFEWLPYKHLECGP